MLSVTSAKLSGVPGSTGWSQIHEFVPDSPQKLVNRGRLYIVVSIDNITSGIETLNLGREILNNIQNDYYENNFGGAFDALNKSLNKVSEQFKNSPSKISVIALSVVDSYLYLSVMGEGSIALCRKGVFARILDGKGNIPVTASGFAKEEDVILLATNSFYEHIPLGIIRATVAGPDLNNMVETLAPTIHETANSQTLAALVLQFQPAVNPSIHNEDVEITLPVIKKTPFSTRLSSLITRLGVRLPKRSIYVHPVLNDEVSPHSKKTTFSIALILLVLLAVSIGFGIRQKKLNDSKNKYQGLLSQAKNDLEQAVSIASVSPDTSRELFADSQSKIAEIDSMKVKDAELTNLKRKIEESRAAILGEYRTNPEMYLDLSLLSSGFKGDTVAFSGGQLYVFDKAGSRVVSVDLTSKKSKVVAGPGVINNGSAIACYEDNVFVLEPDGIYEVDSGSQKVIPKTWSGDALIASFAGNLYVIDKAGGEIYRYQAQGSNFNEKQNWLSSGVSANFTEVSQIVLDGSIYALYPQSKILRFSQGSPQNFNIKGVTPEIGNIDAISTSSDNANVYLLDKAGMRVVVTDKKGFYKAQYVSEQIGQATNLVVSEADKKIILLTGDKLYLINLQN